MLYIFSRRFIFIFLIASVTFIQAYSAVQEFAAQSKEEENYFKTQKILLTEFGKIHKEEKSISNLIGSTIASNQKLKKQQGFSASFTTFDDIKDKIPQINSELSNISETYAESNLTTENTEADLGSSPHDTILTSDDDTLHSLFNPNNTVNTHSSIYSNPFINDKKEEKNDTTIQPPIILNIPNDNSDLENPFGQTIVTESTSSDSSSKKRKQHKKDTPWLRRLFCIAPVN